MSIVAVVLLLFSGVLQGAFWLYEHYTHQVVSWGVIKWAAIASYFIAAFVVWRFEHDRRRRLEASNAAGNHIPDFSCSRIIYGWRGNAGGANVLFLVVHLVNVGATSPVGRFTVTHGPTGGEALGTIGEIPNEAKKSRNPYILVPRNEQAKRDGVSLRSPCNVAIWATFPSSLEFNASEVRFSFIDQDERTYSLRIPALARAAMVSEAGSLYPFERNGVYRKVSRLPTLDEILDR